MSKVDDIDHEVRNTVVRLRGQFKRIEKVVREIEKDLEDLDRRLARIENVVTADPYP